MSGMATCINGNYDSVQGRREMFGSWAAQLVLLVVVPHFSPSYTFWSRKLRSSRVVIKLYFFITMQHKGKLTLFK